MITVSKRLARIVSYINAETIADVACDHAYISVAALQKGAARRAIACDINAASVEKARKNILDQRLSDKIESRQANGLCGLSHSEADTVIIAGVGGRLICDILNNDTEKTKSFARFILQPQRDAQLTRKSLHAAGFMICDEDMIFDGGIYYPIIEAAQGAERPYTDIEYLFGKIPLEGGDPVLKEYIILKLRQIENIKNPEIEEKIKVYKEALEWLS